MSANSTAGSTVATQRQVGVERSRVFLYSVIALVSLVGLADALYLTYEHITGESVRCTITSGCSEVLSSPYAVFAGIPLAALGAAAYFGVFSLATLAAFGYRFVGGLLTLLVGGMLLASAWLFYLQAVVIKHFCQYCLLSAGTTLLLSIIVSSIWLKGQKR